jgi:RNA polymerase sigma-70 factor, ECF subfamily
MSTARFHERVLLSAYSPSEVSVSEASQDDSSLSPASLEDLGELYRTYAHFVARFVTSIGAPRADIEDLVQEVFLVAHRRGGFREQGAKPTTWLAAIAWRIVGTHRRGMRRREEVVNTTEASEEHRETVADGAPDAYARQAASETLSDVQRALATLEPEHAAIFVLFEIEEQSCPDIAETFGLPLGTVHSRLHYARKAFNESFAKISRTRVKVGELPPKGSRQP